MEREYLQTSESLDVVYQQMCQARKTEPQDCVVIRLQNSCIKDGGEVDLSNLTLTSSTCSILANIFRNDVAVVRLKLADCMVSEKSLKLMLKGLEYNTCLRELDLRGNNLRQISCDALGSFLKGNNYVTHLLLEWNCLGYFNSSFANFCCGLATNTSVKHLDLRNNQIDHKGAQELASALQFNKTLKTLDLRWNNIGLSGGRCINDALKKNKALETLEICGNNIPVDISDSMEATIFHNRGKTSSLEQIKLSALHNEIQFLKKSKKEQMETLVHYKESKNSQLNQISTCSSNQLLYLQQTLEERKQAMNTLRAKLDMTEANLEMLQQQYQEKELLVKLARKDCQEIIKTNECERQLEKKNSDEKICQLQEKLEDSQTKCSSLESNVVDWERKAKNYQQELSLLKKTLSQSNCDHRKELTDMEERTCCERQRLIDEMKEREERREEETKKIREEAEKIRQCSENKVDEILGCKSDMQCEIMELKKQLVDVKCQHDEEIRKLNCDLKQQHEIIQKKLEDKISNLLSEKSELQKQLSTANGQVLEEQSTRQSLEIETKSHRNSVNKLKNQLETRECEHEQEICGLRNEMRKREVQTQDELNRVSELRNTISKLISEKDDQATNFRVNIKEKDETIDDLRCCLHKYENEMDRTREEETRRLDVLHNALMNYMQSSQMNKSSPLRRSQVNGM